MPTRRGKETIKKHSEEGSSGEKGETPVPLPSRGASPVLLYWGSRTENAASGPSVAGIAAITTASSNME